MAVHDVMLTSGLVSWVQKTWDFLKKPNPVGFIGFFGQAGKIGKIIQKISNLKP